MDYLHLVAPDVRDIVAEFPPLLPTVELLPALREAVPGLYPPSDAPFEAHHVTGLNGAPDVRVLIHRPASAAGAVPAILYGHGGGFVAGTPDMMAAASAKLAEEQGAVVVAVQYRLAPETPFPGPVEDCHAALTWMAAEAGMLGIDAARIAISGQSAGGGLAAATAQMARDLNGPSVKAQFLLYPMLDARTATEAAPVDNPTTGTFGWVRESNLFGWSAMRGTSEIPAERLGHFSPAEAETLEGLPATFIAIGSLDLFLEESLTYAQRLSRAGVPVEAHVIPVPSMASRCSRVTCRRPSAGPLPWPCAGPLWPEPCASRSEASADMDAPLKFCCIGAVTGPEMPMRCFRGCSSIARSALARTWPLSAAPASPRRRSWTNSASNPRRMSGWIASAPPSAASLPGRSSPRCGRQTSTFRRSLRTMGMRRIAIARRPCCSM